MRAFPLLSLVVFAPWAGAALLAARPRLGARASRGIALAFSLSTLALAAVLLGSFSRASTGFQFVEQAGWIPSLHVQYHLGLDGLSLLLVLLVGILGPLGLVASWRQASDPRFFGLLFLLLQGATLGVFLALDFFHWFVFWELSLVPAYFLIRLWGGPGAARAAYQFVIYTMGGSAFLLLGFAAIFAATGTLDFVQLARLGASGALAARLAGLGGFWPEAVFLGVLLGFAVKVPLFPFHAWQPPAYAEAPTGVSMYLTGVMAKMGVYGFLRLLWPLFPGPLHAAAVPLLWLALGGVVLGAFSAMRQTDLKRMVAYSSINHLSYCLLALFAVAAASGRARPAGDAATAAFSGILLQVFNHGLSAAALFYVVGALEARAGGRRGLGDFGGVRTAAPVLAGLGGIALFSSLGLPGLNGFIGEFLIFRGVWGLAAWTVPIACLGLFATAFFLLTFWQRVFHGPRAGAAAGEFPDATGLDLAVLVPLVALMLLLGVLPQLLTGLFNPLITQWAAALPLP
jgi:NADH-quinone oxidoreductase subunit M